MTTRPCPQPGTRRALAASALAGLFLAACGGDSGGTPPAPPPPPPPITQVPASAAADDASWEAFAIAQAPTEDREPLTLELVTTVPGGETEEPIVLP
jgi:hypothetical protein